MTKCKILHLPTGEYLYHRILSRQAIYTLYTKKEAEIRFKSDKKLIFSDVFESIQNAKEQLAFSVQSISFDFDDFKSVRLLKEHVEIIEVDDNGL